MALAHGRAATIKDIAAAAGVSVATVSHVLEGKDGRFSPATAERVHAVAKKLHYRRNHIARSLVRRRTQCLAFATQREYGLLTRNAYFTAVLDGMLEHVVSASYQLKIIAVGTDPADLALLDDGTVDGIALVAPAIASPMLAWARGSRIPCVSVSVTPPKAPFTCIGIDDRAAAQEATAALIALGHRRIAIITDLQEQLSGRERCDGYLQALADAGIRAQPAWQAQARYLAEEGDRAARALLALDPRPTAILCASDLIALGALNAAADLSVSVPRDLSVIGFDDIAAAEHARPPLTTVHQPLHELGTTAAATLIAHIETGRRGPLRIVLPTTLVQRGSTAPPRR